MTDIQDIPAGVGAFNQRSEVLVAIYPLGVVPDAYRCDGERIDLLCAGKVVHSARYGRLVSEGAANARHILVGELGADETFVRGHKVAKSG